MKDASEWAGKTMSRPRKVNSETMMLQVRVPVGLIKRVSHVALELDANRSVAVIYLLERGLAATGEWHEFSESDT